MSGKRGIQNKYTEMLLMRTLLSINSYQLNFHVAQRGGGPGDEAISHYCTSKLVYKIYKNCTEYTAVCLDEQSGRQTSIVPQPTRLSTSGKLTVLGYHCFVLSSN